MEDDEYYNFVYAADANDADMVDDLVYDKNVVGGVVIDKQTEAEDDDDDEAEEHIAVEPKIPRLTPPVDVNHNNKYGIKPLDISTVRPTRNWAVSKIGGSKIIILGAPNSGKSILIKDILHSKRDIVPVGCVVSGTEAVNNFYSPIFPDCFIYNKFEPSLIDRIYKRQEMAKKYVKNPWAILVLDDCMADTKMMKTKAVSDLIKNSRHWDLTTFIVNQYVFDMDPSLRTNFDGIFIFRTGNINNLKKIYLNFASIIPTFTEFSDIMSNMTTDYNCIYIDMQPKSNDWRSAVFYYKAKVHDAFKFGSQDYWDFSKARCIKN